MMESVLILRHIKVENANAIAGFTYGFPAVSNFLGFTHALSRAAQKKLGLTLGGCAVVCHQHHVNAHQPAGWGDYVFSLTRNPLTKEAQTSPFVEEGRMQMEVSLLIECDFNGWDLDFGMDSVDQDIARFEDFIKNIALTQRLAGGTIQSIEKAILAQLPEGSEQELTKFRRKQLFKLLPGFALIDRSELLREHYQRLTAEKPDAELIDAWLDFCALKYRAYPEIKESEPPTEETKVSWKYIPKPAGGWLVPIVTGFKAISPLYEAGQVARARDPTTPFRFVESVYGIGEWLGLHRVLDLEQIFWHYEANGDFYLCRNRYASSVEESNTQSDQ